jgi:hypothetical protein
VGFGSWGNTSNGRDPFDKIVELYEALLKSEKEKVELLQKMLDKK